MTKRAKFLRCWYPEGHKTLVYEYRGREYEINPELYTATAIQHRMAQERIDIQIEREQAHAEYERTHPYRYEDTAQAGFDLFWAWCEGKADDKEMGL